MWISSRNMDPGFFNLGLVRVTQGTSHSKIKWIGAKMPELGTHEVLRKLWNFFLATLSEGEKKGPLIWDQRPRNIYGTCAARQNETSNPILVPGTGTVPGTTWFSYIAGRIPMSFVSHLSLIHI